jgi:large subunit ribosomal protein L13
MEKGLRLLDKQPSTIIVDVANCIAGRTCSRVSKLLLEGNKVSIGNAEKAMISGNRYKTIETYKEDLEINSVTNPIHGPFHPRRPDTILTRMVRGMIPKRKTKGVEAFKQLRVYIGVPEKLSQHEVKRFEDCNISKPESFYITIGDIAKQIGWEGEIK